MQIYAQKNATLQSALYFTHFYDNFNPLTRLSLIATLWSQSFWKTYALQCFFNDN